VQAVTGYAVDPSELQHSDAVLGGAAARSRAALGQLVATGADLLDGRWQGGAAAAFRLAWEQWLDGVTTMVDALDDTARALGCSGGGYAATEEAVRAGIAGAQA
jgi:WXG100 family type VII secretion target